jgi:hypothetical protein
MMTSARHHQGLGEPGDVAGLVGEGDDRDDGVPAGHLDRHPGGDQVGLDRVAVCSGPGQQDDEFGRLDTGPAEDGEAGHFGQPVPGRGQAR